MTESSFVRIREETHGRRGSQIAGDQAHEKRPLHLVSIWAAANRAVLAQTTVESGKYEITGISEMLLMLEVSVSTNTINAIGFQDSIAQ